MTLGLVRLGLGYLTMRGGISRWICRTTTIAIETADAIDSVYKSVQLWVQDREAKMIREDNERNGDGL